MYSSMYFVQNLGVLFIQMKTDIGNGDFSRKLFAAFARLRRRGKSVGEEETVEIARAKGDLINHKTEKGEERREGWLHVGHWPPAPPSHPPRRIQIQTHSQTCNRRPKEGDAAVKGNKTRSSVKLWVNFRNNSTKSKSK